MLSICAFSLISGLASAVGSRRSVQGTVLVGLVALTFVAAAFAGYGTHSVLAAGAGVAVLFMLGSAIPGVLDRPGERGVAARVHPDLI